MQELILNRITLVWLILVAATVLSFSLSGDFTVDDLEMAGVAILVTSFIKVRFVISEFMEINHAPLAFRLIADLWCGGTCVLLVALFLFPL